MLKNGSPIKTFGDDKLFIHRSTKKHSTILQGHAPVIDDRSGLLNDVSFFLFLYPKHEATDLPGAACSKEIEPFTVMLRTELLSKGGML